MSLPSYEELEGSPKITFDRKGGSAERIFKIAWVDINAFFTALFPSPLSGYPVVAWVPGYSWMLAQSAQAEPFDPTKPGGVNVGSDTTYSDTAKISVKYGPPQEDQQQQASSSGDGAAGGGGDGTGPGGKNGATGGEKGSASQPVQLVEHTIHIGAEFLTISNLLLYWNDGTPANAKVRAGKVVSTIEHQTTWHNIVQVPWDNIRKCVGCVNKGEFLGGKEECVLFLGAEANRDLTNKGQKTWTIKYKFSEKDLKAPEGWGWNHFFRAEANAPKPIDRLLLKDASTIYKIVKFQGLYNAEVQPITV